ncbi:unnamed protein product [Cyprideis torosa]|uniref:tRNA (guanine(46)-N(7))-methyltransferase n=1 Tax=Cyprideis torosa TaxID=163714 RepID=A0A7R8VZT8_9CRUS|nr:unnamed protein product [Cyprideis torosa]CAG0878789.1 unnamed protein product [Cyprideis torosa]
MRVRILSSPRPMSEELKLTSRSIRSFVVRNGRITQGQQRAFDENWLTFGIEYTQSHIDWSAEFGRDAPLWIEIGFGNGIQTAHMAELYPQTNFVGIEIHMPGVGRLLSQIQERQLKNLRIIRHDAVEVLQNCVSDEQAERILLFFPDPWPKKKHHKRRIVQADFTKLVSQKLKTGGYFHLATDWEEYALHMLETIGAEKDLENQSTDNTFIPPPEYRLITKFEKRGLKRGHEVWDLLFRKS